MPRNTSGLRRGGPGRPKGSRNKIPGSFKASVKAVYQEIASSDPALIEDAIRKGLQARPPASFQYLQLAAHYIDGKPAETVKLKGSVTLPPIQIVPPTDAET